MAVVLIEGFDHLTAAQMPLKGWVAGGTAYVNTTGRLSGQAARMSVSSNLVHAVWTKTLPSSYATLVGGFAFRTNVGTNTTTHSIFQLLGPSNAGAAVQLRTDNKLQILSTFTGGVIATGTTVLIQNVWYYIELKCFINVGTPASGSCELHLNGVAGEIASTVGNFGANAHTVCRIGQNTDFNAGTINEDFDDIYVLDTSGSFNNDFEGDMRVETLYPSGDGAHTDWAPNTGTTHFNLVNQVATDDDTTYVSSATPGQRDLYTVPALSALAGKVAGVQVNLYARKDDANTRQISTVIRQAGTDYDGTPGAALSTSYTETSQVYPLDPTGAQWTINTVNTNQYGVKEVA